MNKDTFIIMMSNDFHLKTNKIFVYFCTADNFLSGFIYKQDTQILQYLISSVINTSVLVSVVQIIADWTD